MNLKEVFLGLAVLILTFFVITYGINAISPQPKYEDFCTPSLWQQTQPLNETSCFELGGKWHSQDIKCIKQPCPHGYCDQEYSCRRAYNLNLERYNMNVFLIAVPLGIILILLGAYFFSLDAVGVGIMGGGLGSILKGLTSYWAYTSDVVRFLISLVGLVIVIYFGYKFQDRIKGKKKK